MANVRQAATGLRQRDGPRSPRMSDVIDHVGIRVSDLRASRRLYEAALAELGFVVLSEGAFEGDAYRAFACGAFEAAARATSASPGG